MRKEMNDTVTVIFLKKATQQVVEIFMAILSRLVTIRVRPLNLKYPKADLAKLLNSW